MAKHIPDIRSLARAQSKNAMNVLQAIMMEPQSPPSCRVAAACYIIDRGWGRAAQVVMGDKDNPLTLNVNITDDQRAEALRLYFMKTVQHSAAELPHKDCAVIEDKSET